MIQDQTSRYPTGGAIWKSDLGQSWGALGPIGVSTEIRGQGYGNAILGKALEELRLRGARRTIIDWTNLVEFYGAHGFTVNRQYRSYHLSLTADRQP